MKEYLISVEDMKKINGQVVSDLTARWNEVIREIRNNDFYSEQLKERYVDKLVDSMKEWELYGYIKVIAIDEELTFKPILINEITEVVATIKK